MAVDDYSNTIIGWREWVGLPEIGVPWLKAKVDSGAQTSALHAVDIEPFERHGQEWVRFGVCPWQRNELDTRRISLPVADRRTVRSSSGHSENRYVVAMDLELAGQRITADVTLTDRDEMVFRMLIGREALRQGFFVDARRSFLGGRPPLPVRRRNLKSHSRAA